MTKTFSMHKIKVILNDYFSKVEKQRIRVVLSASKRCKNL